MNLKEEQHMIQRMHSSGLEYALAVAEFEQNIAVVTLSLTLVLDVSLMRPRLR